jgi:hypothetical protein
MFHLFAPGEGSGGGGQKGEILIYIPDYLSAFSLMKSAAFYLLLTELGTSLL